MSKKDYQAIAVAIHRAVLHPYRYVNAFSVDMLNDGARTAFHQIVDGLADMFANDNPRFDRARFVEACRTGKTRGMRQVTP